MLSMNDGRAGLLGGGRVRHAHAWSPEAAAVLVAAVVLFALVF